MGFLCKHHRDSLRDCPPLAQRRWQEWLSAGQQAMAEGNWSRAIRLLGSSYELSDYLWDLPAEHHQLSPLDRMMVSGHLLAECFGRSGNLALERHYLLAVHHRLTRDVPGPESLPASRRKNLKISLLMLQRHCRLHGPSCGLQACLTQGQQLLATRPAAVH